MIHRPKLRAALAADEGRVSTSLPGHGASSDRGCYVARSLRLLVIRQLRYRDHPELAKVKVATGEENGLPEGQLGVVTAKAEGYSTCDSSSPRR
jgi:hypothetical protein